VFAISFVRTLFFLAPGLVALAEIPDGAAGFVRFNPLTGLFEAYRSVFLYGEAPAAWHVLYPLAVAAALLAVFVPLYRTEQYQFAKVVE
jgi:ABC-type polysaccharide/polyol phosphate export permease